MVTNQTGFLTLALINMNERMQYRFCATECGAHVNYCRAWRISAVPTCPVLCFNSRGALTVSDNL